MKSQSCDDPKGEIYEQIAKIANSLSSPARLKIIQLLAQGPKNVDQLSQLIGESIANTSQHLQRLARVRLVTIQRKGNERIYQTAHPLLPKLWETLQDLSQEVAPELRQAEAQVTSPDIQTKQSIQEVLALVRANKAVLLDVRDEAETTASPFIEAVSIPLGRLSKEIHNLPKRIPVFAVCRGRFCGMATDAVRVLREHGIKAYRLRESPFSFNEAVTGKRRSGKAD